MSTQDPAEVQREVEEKFYIFMQAAVRADARGDEAAIEKLFADFLSYVTALAEKQTYRHELHSWLQQIAVDVNRDLQERREKLPAIKAMIQALECEDTTKVLTQIDSLIELGPIACSALSALVGLAQDRRRTPQIRVAAITAIGITGANGVGGDFLHELTEIVKNPDEAPIICLAAIKAIITIVGDDCESTILPDLVEIARSTMPQEDEREKAIFGWARAFFSRIFLQSLDEGKDLYIPGFSTNGFPPLEIPPGPLGDLYDGAGTLLWGLD